MRVQQPIRTHLDTWNWERLLMVSLSSQHYLFIINIWHDFIECWHFSLNS